MQEYVQKSTSTTFPLSLASERGAPSGVLIQSLIPSKSGARGSPPCAAAEPTLPDPFSFSISARAVELRSIRFWSDAV